MSVSPTHPPRLAQTWASPVILAQGPQLRQPVLVVSSDRLDLFWEGQNAIYHRYGDGSAWQPPIRLVGGRQPAAVSDRSGALHLAFANDYSGRYEIYYTVRKGHAWSLPQNVSLTPGTSAYPQVLIAPDGVVHLLWEDDSPGYPVIYHARQRATWRWDGRPIPHAAGRRPCGAFDTTGRMHVVFQTGDEGDIAGDVFYTCWDGRSWSAPQRLSDGTHPAAGPHLVVDGADTVHVVWRERAEPYERIVHTCAQSQVWSEPQPLSAPLERGGWPALAAGNGLVAAVWDYLETLEYSARPTAKGEWQAIELAVAENYRPQEPWLALAETGEAHLVWLCANAQGDTEIHYTRRHGQEHRVFLPRV